MTDSPIAVVPSSVQDPAERDRQLFEDAPIAYHELDTEGVIREVNKTECQLLGYRPEELIGHYIWEFVAEEQQQAARETIAAALARLEPLTAVECEFRHRDGQYLWVEIHRKVIENAAGDVVGIRSALLDVTERRRLEAEVLRQHDWMRFAFRSGTKAVMTADILGRISTMNPAAETITGWREEEALGRPMERICRVQRDSGEPVDLMSCILAESAISNRLRNFVMIDRSGASQSIQWSVSPILNDDEVIVGAMLVVEKS
jgi:two-component system sensor histidine kinase/response regulator